MTKHYEKLREYAALVAKDYGVGEKFFAAVQSDLTELGRVMGMNLMQRGFGMLHDGLDRLAMGGLQRIGEAIAAAGKRK